MVSFGLTSCRTVTTPARPSTRPGPAVGSGPGLALAHIFSGQDVPRDPSPKREKVARLQAESDGGALPAVPHPALIQICANARDDGEVSPTPDYPVLPHVEPDLKGPSRNTQRLGPRTAARPATRPRPAVGSGERACADDDGLAFLAKDGRRSSP